MRWRYLGLVMMGSASASVAGCGDDATTPPQTQGTGVDPTTGLATTGAEGSGGSEAATESGQGSTTGSADTTVGVASDSTGPATACGNAMIEDPEVCDGTELDGQTCWSLGFDDGRLGCAADCSSFDQSGCVMFSCGDNLAEGRELCDGTDLAGVTCADEGFDSGTLVCGERCASFDTSGCGTCGNVVVDGAEACDDIVLFGQTCVTQGFDNGDLACNADCLDFDTSGCGVCGNGVIDGAESCDEALLGGSTCLTEGFDSGVLACAGNCIDFETEGCGLCGNGVIDGDELCDGTDVGVATCVGQGFDSGALTCQAAGCGGYDTSGCGVCGNMIVDGFEACDDGNMDDTDDCPNDCLGPDRIVFVSSVMFNGDFGGLAGADAQCQALAVAAGLPGTFLVWMSTDTESPATRMTQSPVPYVRTDGVVVAPNWAGLIDGNLDAPINVTELGGPVPIGNTNCAGGGFPTVWTSTNSLGASQIGSNCSNWTSNVGGSRWGRADETGGSWTSWCSGGQCDWLSPIYCVQQ